MYSVVLLMAMSTGGDLPAAHRGGGCGGGACYGACYGGGYGYSCNGGCRGGRARGGRRHGCNGGCQGYSCCGYVPVVYGCCGCYGTVMPGKTPEKIKDMPKPKKTTAAPTSATLVVNLPADAKLLIDNEPTTSTGASRVFVSPALNPGQEYHYTLKAEVVRAGKPVQVERVIAVRAGEITPVPLTLPPAGVAQR